MSAGVIQDTLNYKNLYTDDPGNAEAERSREDAFTRVRRANLACCMSHKSAALRHSRRAVRRRTTCHFICGQLGTNEVAEAFFADFAAPTVTRVRFLPRQVRLLASSRSEFVRRLRKTADQAKVDRCVHAGTEKAARGRSALHHRGCVLAMQVARGGQASSDEVGERGGKLAVYEPADLTIACAAPLDAQRSH